MSVSDISSNSVEERQYDVVIVGGGIIGLSTAMQLLERSPDLNVAVIEEDDGWYLDRITGSHHIFKHSEKPGVVPVVHPRKDIPIGALRNIERQSGVRLRR